MTRLAGALAAAALALAGCAALSSPAGPSPAPTATPATIAITDGDLGRTFHARPGDNLSVLLHQPAGYTPWQLSSSDPEVLERVVDTRAAAPAGVTMAEFRAVAAGTAMIRASSAISCPGGQVCPALARGWAVTVQVA